MCLQVLLLTYVLADIVDWTSPLTPPPPSTTRNRNHSPQQSQQQQQQQQQQQHNNSNNLNIDLIETGDVVDGRQPTLQQPQPQHQHQQQHQQQQQQQSQLQQQQQHNQYQYYHNYNYNQQYYDHQAMEAAATSSHYAYNNNLLYADASTPTEAATAAEAAVGTPEHFGMMSTDNADLDAELVNDVSLCLQAQLRAAKSQHLGCTEVTLPANLTTCIAAQIVKMSEREPCGVRGCTVYIEFADEPNNTRRIASFKVDPSTVSTFELYLTLKHDKRGWTSLLPQFIKNLTRSSTILISPDFTLTKNKLYCE